jgi:hypothetical protein
MVQRGSAVPRPQASEGPFSTKVKIIIPFSGLSGFGICYLFILNQGINLENVWC